METKYKAACTDCKTIYTQQDFLELNICSGECPVCAKELVEVK